jgi:hypothetical protein
MKPRGWKLNPHWVMLHEALMRERRAKAEFLMHSARAQEIMEQASKVRHVSPRKNSNRSWKAPMTHPITDHHDGDEIYWRYPTVHGPAPRGVKLTLLTIGNQQVTGDWAEGGGFKAWSPLIRRDKEVERQLGYL